MTTPSVPAPDAVDRLLQWLQTEDTVVVGGQAVALWAEHLGVVDGRPSITSDIDFYGMRADVEEASRNLAGVSHDVNVATFDDATVNSGTIVIHRGAVAGLATDLTVDYLHSVLGLNGPDIQSRAVALLVGGSRVRVLHPVLLLESKIANLGALPRTRNDAGLTQVRLAVAIVGAFMRRYSGWTPETRRAFLDTAERLGRLGRADVAHFAFHVFGIDVLAACPTELAPADSEFALRRWPQVVAAVAERREAFRRHLPASPTPEATRTLRVG